MCSTGWTNTWCYTSLSLLLSAELCVIAMRVLYRLPWVIIGAWLCSITVLYVYTVDQNYSLSHVEPTDEQIFDIIDGVVYISIGELARENLADYSIATLRKIGKWRGAVYLITDHPECFVETSEKFNVDLLKAPSYTNILDIKALKTRIFEYVPKKVDSVLYLDVDILVTRSVRSFLRDITTLHPDAWKERDYIRNGNYSHFLTIPPGKHVNLKKGTGGNAHFDMGVFLDAGGHFVGFCSGCEKWHTGILWVRRNHGTNCLHEWGKILKSGKYGTDQESIDEAERQGFCSGLSTLPFRHLLFGKDYLMMLFRTGQTFTHLTAAARMNSQDFFYHYMVSRFHNSINRLVDSEILEKHKLCQQSPPQAISVNDFAGIYSDPNHVDCFRKIELQEGEKMRIVGSDNVDGTNQWILPASVDKKRGDIVVDFSQKGGPSSLVGSYNRVKGAIEWPDGNVWTKK